jgi:N-acetylglutamate synthase-like GNAT family acetyltransferase
MPEVTIRTNIRDEDIERIVSRHRFLYEKEFGYNSDFGDYVEESLEHYPKQLLIAEEEDEFAGCIGVVEIDNESAQLRWFLVEPKFRGKHIGKKLMQAIIDHCEEKKYKRIFLWTVDELHAARKLYMEFGFELAETLPKQLLWGKSIIQQRWDLSLETNG